MATLLCFVTSCMPGLSICDICSFGDFLHVSRLELFATAGACPCWCTAWLCELEVCSLSKAIRQHVAATGAARISPPLLRVAQVRRQIGACTLTCGLFVWTVGSWIVKYDKEWEEERLQHRLELYEGWYTEEDAQRATARAAAEHDTDALYFLIVVAVGAAYCWFNCCARRTDDESLVLPTRALNPVAGASSSFPPTRRCSKNDCLCSSSRVG